MSSPSIRRAVLSCLLVAAVVLACFGNAGARWVDVHWLHERIKDHWGAWHDHEDWSTLQPLPGGMDKAWLAAGGPGPLRIAHALGDSGEAGANTLQAFQVARAAGFRLFEVDLALDEAGRLRCHHGPEPLPAYGADACTFERLLPLVAQADGWLILDIKDDFPRTADAVVATLRSIGHADRVIFQLYVPRDVQWFRTAVAGLGLPAPIVTAYVSRRSVDHLAGQVGRIGAAAFAVPLPKLAALSVATDVPLLVHPVHTCDDQRELAGHAVRGIYTVTRARLAACAR